MNSMELQKLRTFVRQSSTKVCQSCYGKKSIATHLLIPKQPPPDDSAHICLHLHELLLYYSYVESYGRKKLVLLGWRVIAAWKKPETMFSGGKGGHCPPIFGTIIFNRPEKGAGVWAPPNIWSRNKKVSPTRCKTPQNSQVADCANYLGVQWSGKS